MMECTILAPGPSLSGFDGSSPRPWIGINAAATAWECDYLAFIDHHRAHLNTVRYILDRIIGCPELIGKRDVGRHPRDPIPTVILALEYAIVVVGAKRIYTAGVDFAGTASFDGRQTKAQEELRNDHRWRIERLNWHARMRANKVSWVNLGAQNRDVHHAAGGSAAKADG